MKKMKVAATALVLSVVTMMNAHATSVNHPISLAHKKVTECYYVDGYNSKTTAKSRTERIQSNTAVWIKNGTNKFISLDLPNTEWKVSKNNKVDIKCVNSKKRIYTFKLKSKKSYLILKKGTRRIIVGSKSMSTACNKAKYVSARDEANHSLPHRLHVCPCEFKTSVKYSRNTRLVSWSPVPIADCYRIQINAGDAPPYKTFTYKTSYKIPTSEKNIRFCIEPVKQGAFESFFGEKTYLSIG